MARPESCGPAMLLTRQRVCSTAGARYAARFDRPRWAYSVPRHHPYGASLMDQGTTQMLKRTPFHDLHIALGAKMVPFAGYEMPVQYPTGITAEHNAVRERCGLFDVSHMGEFLIRGPGAIDFVNYVTTNNVPGLAVGQAQYSSILNDRGTFEDDCLVYRSDDGIMMVVNASNIAKDRAHIGQHLERF